MRLGRRPLSVAATFAAAALCLGSLTGCDAGHPEPASDNRWPGPELTIVHPGPGQVVDLKTWVDVSAADLPAEYENDPSTPEQPQVARYSMPQAYFEVLRPAPVAEHEGDALLWRLNGGRWMRIERGNLGRGISLGDRLMGAGSHVLQAVVVNSEGIPYANRQAASTRLFHLHTNDGSRDLYHADRDPPLAPFVETHPWLMVLGPTGTITSTEGALRFAVSGTTLSKTSYRVAYRVDGGDWQYAYKAGGADLGDVPAGKHTVTVRLEALDINADEGEAWSPMPRPRFARTMQDAAPGELNLQTLTFTVGS